ncbi:glycosyltransferase family 29 protein [Neptunomonas sp.]|uniref:glycosyltransferase family 29 protein n=1 Tax=Neptunomonas sp. TaxID=1971898 RepID=UPI003568D357
MKVKLIAIEPSLELSTSVAVVGNSPKILGRKLGEEIDSHDDVIRFNGALIEDYAVDVGRKTTIEFIGIDIAYLFSPPYKRPSKDELVNEDVRLHNARKIFEIFGDAKFVTFHPNDEDRNLKNKQYKTALYLKSVGAQNKLHYFTEKEIGSAMNYYTANKDLESLNLSSRLKFGGPRTGFKVILRLVLSGVVPDLYSFDIDPTLEFANHYYDDITNEKISEYKPHDIQGEMFALIEMHKNGLINIIC